MKLTKQIGLFVAASMLAFACGAPSETVETTEAQEVAEATGQTLALKTDETVIAWRGYKPTGQHFGKIPATTGELVVADGTIKGGTFTFDITGLTIEDMEAGTENHGKLFSHLQSADFFDAANYPTATFEITGVEPFTAGDKVEDKEEFISENTPNSASSLSPESPTHWISGNLTMRGTTKNIKFPAAVTIADGTVKAKAGFNIDRTAWGLAYGDEATAVDKAKDQFIYNTVSLVLDVTAQ
ncbi:YceI family protein [Algoriphagus boritolerans]|uniref:YceI-like domain-containing protein n=1 Tax=Algoriphagus boritolerans DSM 17298 = JCM 18970 TaxID=1120964 RepID=A0A1H5XEQ0_9BACT|nr:YceI family protein [Algoriphagus boritolerans]SEG09900.1 YceI-like domain-containing protein [Algoriphagus boritolerans DSM 17298 = JCM 18970]